MSRLTFLITVIILTFTGVILASGVRSQNLKTVKVALNMTGNLKTVLSELEKKSGLGFVYAEEIGNITGISLSAENTTMDAILKKMARQKSLQFEQSGSLIIVTNAPAPIEPGKIYGKIVDDKGASLPGATIRIIELNTTTISAVDGTYSFSAAPGSYTIEVSYISYQTKRIADVMVRSKILTPLNIVLLNASNALTTIVIQSSYKKESAAGLYATQKNAASITDGISAEQIAATPDNNMGQVLKRVSGVSTVDNRYVIVRGLTERYNQGMIDGITLPSTDMNRRNFAFDVIPVEMVSNVVVNKTATPDISSEFSGGQISVNTLDIPLEKFTILTAGTGFNSNTLGKTFTQAGRKGKYDFWGFDDGHRKLPEGIRSWGNGPIPDYAVAQSKLFSSDAFKMYRTPGNLNQNYRLSAGNVYQLKNEQKIGFVAGISLRHSEEISEFKDVRGMTFYGRYPEPQLALIDTAFGRRNGQINKYRTSVGAQLNAGIQGSSYKIGFKNLFSQTFNNTFTGSTGSISEVVPLNEQRTRRVIQDPEFTRVFQHRLEGEHKLTAQGLKFTWMAAQTRVRQELRDRVKFTYRLTGTQNGEEYFQSPGVITPSDVTPDTDYRMFTDTKQTDYNWAANISQPFRFMGGNSLVKAGYNGTHKKRGLDAAKLKILTQDRNFDGFSRPYENLLLPDSIGTGLNQAYYFADGNNGTQFDGTARLHAGYLMLDQRFFENIRIVYGVRA